VKAQKAKVVALGVVVAVVYGIIHDQITVRLCVEYFSLAHPPLFPVSSPTLLGLCWGIAATSGVGLILGFLLARASQSPGLPPMPVRSLVRPLLVLVTLTAIGATAAGCVGYSLSRHHVISLNNLLAGQWVELLSPSQRDRFMAVWFAHGASYILGVVGGGALILRIWLERKRPRLLPLVPRTGLELLRLLVVVAILAMALWWRLLRTTE
jgi:hypothetical protein